MSEEPLPPEFETLYRETLLPELARLERRRHALLVGFAGMLVAFGAAVLLAIRLRQSRGWFVVVLAAAGLVVIFVVDRLVRAYRRAFRRRVVGPIVGALGVGLEYRPACNIFGSEAWRTPLLKGSEGYVRGSDHVAGEPRGVRVEFSLVAADFQGVDQALGRGDLGGFILERRGGARHPVVRARLEILRRFMSLAEGYRFQGVFLVAELGRKLAGVTVVLPDVAEQSLGPAGRVLQRLNFAQPGELIELEDPDFEDRFVVYGSDQVEARVVLTPAVMSRLVALRDRLDRNVWLAFSGDAVYVAFHEDVRVLEPPLVRGLTRPDLALRWYRLLKSAVGLVGDLGLGK